MKPVKVGLLGLGTVGTGVVRIVEGHQEDLRSQSGSPIVIEKILVQNREKARSIKIDSSALTEDPYDIINDPEIDVIIEVMGGVTADQGIYPRSVGTWQACGYGEQRSDGASWTGDYAQGAGASLRCLL